MSDRSETIATFEEILGELLSTVGVTRATLRLDVPSRQFHVDQVTAEALAPGVTSLAADASIDQRQTPTARFIERHRRILVQPDCATADPAPPRELLDRYGVKAQMLGPVVRHGALVGWISVHDTRGARAWRSEDVAALEAGIRRVHAVLDALGA